MINTNKACQREFLIAMNYAYRYGSFEADNFEQAEAEFGNVVDRKLGIFSPRCLVVCENCDRQVHKDDTLLLTDNGEDYYVCGECVRNGYKRGDLS
jgi:hypothetical protein